MWWLFTVALFVGLSVGGGQAASAQTTTTTSPTTTAPDTATQVELSGDQGEAFWWTAGLVCLVAGVVVGGVIDSGRGA